MKLFTTSQVRQYLQEKYNLALSEETLRKNRSLGKPPWPIKLNGMVRYRQADIDDWIQNARYLKALKTAGADVEFTGDIELP